MHVKCLNIAEMYFVCNNVEIVLGLGDQPIHIIVSTWLLQTSAVLNQRLGFMPSKAGLDLMRLKFMVILT